MVRHDISELIKGLKDVDTNSTIEPSWLEHPQILLIVATL